RSPALDAAEDLIHIASEHPELQAIAAHGPALVEACDSNAPADRVAFELLDALSAAADSQTADVALTALRNWCAAKGLAVLPAAWSFAGPFSRQQLRDGEADVTVLF